jgi:hypothetical protein
MKIKYGNTKEARLVTPVVNETIEIQGILELKKTRGLIPRDTGGCSHRQVLSMKKFNWLQFLHLRICGDGMAFGTT